MKISKVAQAIVWISVLTAILGVVTIVNERLYIELYIGAAFIIVAVFMYGFSYIVQAAYVYVQSQPDENDENSVEETGHS